jgi:hypothetical protein
MNLCTIDCVLNPSIGTFCNSNGNRFVNGILESKTFVCELHNRIEPIYEKLEKKLSKMPNTHISKKKAEYLGAAVHDFFESLVN